MSTISFIRDEDGVELLLGGPGEYTLGRGPLLKITDKRVSRTHTLLSLDDNGTAKLCPKHSNPFFHKTTKEDSFFVLSKDNWHPIQDDEKISFLPNELIFTVRLKSSSKEESAVEGATPPLSDVSKSGQDSPSVLLDRPPSPPQSLSVEGGTGKKRNLPSWLTTVPATASKKKATLVKPPEKTPTTTQSTAGDLSASDNDDVSSLRCSSLENKPLVKTKEKVEKKAEASAESSDKKPAKDVSKKNAESDSLSDSTEEDRTKKLTPCPYGKKCYRKNPVHFKEFSHDADSEGEEDQEDEKDKPECPYGTSCYRVNPVHRSQYKHTASPTRAGTKRAGRTSTRDKKKPKKSVLSGDSDDEGEPNTYDYNDSFIDDEELDSGGSSSTSFRGDSEDNDWSPPPDSGEDLSELVSEATSFMKNKKMQRTT